MIILKIAPNAIFFRISFRSNFYSWCCNHFLLIGGKDLNSAINNQIQPNVVNITPNTIKKLLQFIDDKNYKQLLKVGRQAFILQEKLRLKRLEISRLQSKIKIKW